MQSAKRQCLDGKGAQLQRLQAEGGNEDDAQLDLPRMNMHSVMVRAMLDGRLPELVLKEEVDLTRAIQFCLEVLGIGISSPERQSAASRALVGLCTHRKLRPAVDNVLVLRRLCRVIELTDSATALGAAVDALFAVADDSAWQSKVVREACLRCIGTLKDAAKGGNATVAAADDAAAAAATTEVPASATGTAAAAAAGDESGPQEPQGPLIPLLAAAAALLKPSALKLLNDDELVEAAGAVAACLGRCDGISGNGDSDGNGGASGSGGGGGGDAGAGVDGGSNAGAHARLVGALAAILQQRGMPHSLGARADAVAGAEGAIAVLVREIALGTTIPPLGSGGSDGQASGSGGNSSTEAAGSAAASNTPADDSAAAADAAAAAEATSGVRAVGEEGAAPVAGAAATATANQNNVPGIKVEDVGPHAQAQIRAASGRVHVLLTPTARSAFHCLTDVLEHCGRSSARPAATAAAADVAERHGAVAALLPLLRLQPPYEATRALRALLAISGGRRRQRRSPTAAAQQPGNAPGGCPVAAALEAVPDQATQQKLVAAALRAAGPLLACAKDSFVTEALMGLATTLFGGGALGVDQLQENAPALTDAAVGVLLSESPALSWRAFANYASPAAGGSGSVKTDAVSYPARHRAAAARLVCELLEWAAESVYDPVMFGAWLPVNRIARALIRGLVLTHAPPAAAAAAAPGSGASGAGGDESGGAARRAEAECLMRCLQLAEPAEVWRSYSCSDLQTAVTGFGSLLRSGGSAELALAAIGVVSLWSAASEAASGASTSGGNAAELRSLWQALLELLTRALVRATSEFTLDPPRGDGEGDRDPRRQQRRRLAVVAGIVNAAVACLRPSRAVIGRDSRRLKPCLTDRLLRPAPAGDSASGSLLGLYSSWQTGRLTRLPVHGFKYPPCQKLQLAWNFEEAPIPKALVDVCMTFASIAAESYKADLYGKHHGTVASTTARPLAAALGGAVERVSALARAVLRAAFAQQGPGGDGSRGDGSSGDGSGGDGGGADAAAALVETALRVVENAAVVLAACVPPGWSNTA
ncbi:hypothetical protein PLESTB_000892100 [Pleodorina starrii]|uniref:Uncharacterized protein n=1 Tax=Pleodorina starrii TaxID=330485 RepID=A0A9W6BLV3_9CHLO|nr:hypothetical protein PLESTB_000892100 [Pleodorina starrii]